MQLALAFMPVIFILSKIYSFFSGLIELIALLSIYIKVRESMANRSIISAVTLIPANGIKIKLPKREPINPPMRSAEYNGETIFFDPLLHKGWRG